MRQRRVRALQLVSAALALAAGGLAALSITESTSSHRADAPVPPSTELRTDTDAPPPESAGEPEPLAAIELAPAVSIPAVAGFVGILYEDRADLPSAGRLVYAAVWYPTAAGNGPFPLVVFAHGAGSGPEYYSDLLSELSARGYVVVAPQSPPTRFSAPVEVEPTAFGPSPASGPVAVTVGFRTAEGDGGEPEPEGPGEPGPEYTTLYNFQTQHDDVVSAIDAAIDLSVGEGELHGLVDSTRIAVAGHSDGGVTAAAVAYNTAVGDARVRAAVILSGSYGYFGGSWFPEFSPPLLAVHGTDDGVNPFSSSEEIFYADGGGPRMLVAVLGGGHVDAFTSDRTRSAVVALAADFLGFYLSNDPASKRRLDAEVNTADTLELVAQD